MQEEQEEEPKEAKPYKVTTLLNISYEIGINDVTFIYYNHRKAEVNVHFGKANILVKIFKNSIAEIEFEYVKKQIKNS